MTSLLLAACLLFATVDETAKTVRAPEKVQGYLGMGFRWKAHDARRSLVVERVAAGGPADRAGLRAGDVITHIGGVRVAFGDELDFLLFMSERKAGERIVMTAVRAGRAMRLVATLDAMPDGARALWEQNLRVARQRRLANQSSKQR